MRQWQRRQSCRGARCCTHPLLEEDNMWPGFRTDWCETNTAPALEQPASQPTSQQHMCNGRQLHCVPPRTITRQHIPSPGSTKPAAPLGSSVMLRGVRSNAPEPMRFVTRAIPSPKAKVGLLKECGDATREAHQACAAAAIWCASRAARCGSTSLHGSSTCERRESLCTLVRMVCYNLGFWHEGGKAGATLYNMNQPMNPNLS